MPLLLAIFEFSYNEAVVLSQCTVLGNYIIQSVINFRKRHPHDASRPLIYWDVVLILLPAQIGGSTIGVIIEKVLPETLLLILAIVVVIYAGGMSLKKGVIYWMKETDDMNTNLMHNIETSSQDLLKVDNPPEFQMPYFTLKVLVASWCVYAALLVTTQVAVSTCSVGYILTLLSIYPLICCLIAWGVSYAATRQREQPSSVLPGDISFKDISFVPPLLAFLIGIMCSLLGIGGGELMGPLLLSYHVISPVSTATTSMMSLATASSNILHYAILDEIDYRWAVGLFVTGLCGGGNVHVNLFACQSVRPSHMHVTLSHTIIIIRSGSHGGAGGGEQIPQAECVDIRLGDSVSDIPVHPDLRGSIGNTSMGTANILLNSIFLFPFIY